MNITFYQFSKRSNSTKIVDVSGTTLSCELKAPTTILAPALLIKAVPASWNPIWNYCYIPDFDRYYFVNNWGWQNGIWECSLVPDVLASFKTEIGNLNEYILRSSAECDGRVIDTLFPAKAEVTTDMTRIPVFFQHILSSGFYIVGIIGKESTATQGAITYYQMTATEMARLRDYMLSDNFLTQQGLVNLADFIPADATKVIYNPFQYIVSCQWFPFQPSVIAAYQKTAVTSINFGWWNTGTGFSAYRLSDADTLYTRTESVSLTAHPQAAERGEYLNHAPFTSRVLRMEPFGEIQLPDAYLDSTDHIKLIFTCDFVTGIGILEVFAQDTNNLNRMLLTRMTQQIGVSIQLAQVGIDYIGSRTAIEAHTYEAMNTYAGLANSINLSNIGSAIVSGITAGAKAAAYSSYEEVRALGDYLNSKAPQLLTAGTNGSAAVYSTEAFLCSTFYKVVASDNAQLGSPLCKIRQINNIPGYIVCRNPDVSLACFESEREMIIEYMSSGFFYE